MQGSKPETNATSQLHLARPLLALQPYFTNDSVRLYQGDCLNVLPHLCGELQGQVSSVITMVNSREHRRKATGMSDYVHRTRMAIRSAGWFEVDEIPWIKPNSFPGGPNTLPRSSWERILWFSPVSIPDCQPRDMTKPPPVQRDYSSAQRYSRRIGSSGTGSGKDYVHRPPRRPNWIIQPVGEPKDRPTHGYHPARFPTGLAQQLITLFDGLLLDPFGGSGTTGLAAQRAGRSAVLIEQSMQYCEMAARRLAG